MVAHPAVLTELDAEYPNLVHATNEATTTPTVLRCHLANNLNIISASLSISTVSGALMLRACRLAHLSACLSVRKVYCGKTADWIPMPLGWSMG